MASATKQSETVETTKSVTLVLTLEEARTLAVVYSKVGGDLYLSPREHARSVLDALSGINVEWDGAPEERFAHGDGINFSNYSEEG